MRADPVTVRWSTALYNLAARGNALHEVQGDLDRIAAKLGTSKGGPLEGSFHALTTKFVNLAAERDRMDVLKGAAAAFRAEHHLREGILTGHVEASRPLDTETVAKLAQSLSSQLGKSVQLEQRTNPELVGGVRIFVGAKMIDQSVQGRLEGLRRKMLESPLPSV